MKMRYIMRGFTSVVRLPLFLIVVFTISAAAQEQPENNQFNGLDYTLQKPAKNERYAKKKFGDHLFISGEAGLILDRSAGSLFATPGLGLRAGLTVGDWFSPVHGMRVGLNAGLHNGLAGVNPYFVGLSADYLLYGLFHGVLLAATEAFQKTKFYKAHKKELWFRGVSWFVTMQAVFFGFALFSGQITRLACGA